MAADVLTISVDGFEVVSHILTLGYASMLAALFFFILTKNDSLPKYRMSSVISVVVMVSALLLLYMQQLSWTEAFDFDGEFYSLGSRGDLFPNGYRYVMWIINAPMLLIQILFVADVTGVARARYMTRLTVLGALMVVSGYIGQFYEPGRTNEDIALWVVCGIVSTFFLIEILVLVRRVINDGKSRMDEPACGIFGAIRPVFTVAWCLYPVAYAAPILMETGFSYEFTLVSQQVVYTMADVASKVVYGVMLAITAAALSRQAGYERA